MKAAAIWCAGLAAVSAVFSWPFAAGVLLVLASYGVSSLVISWAARVHPPLVMHAGLGTYIFKMMVLFLIFGAVASTGWTGLRPMAFGLLAGTITWITVQAVWTWRATRTDPAAPH
jgi:hypothetical protein